MFSQLRRIESCRQSRNVFANFTRFFTQATSKPITPEIIDKSKSNVAKKAVEEGKVILLTKKHLPQSPLKMKFLVRLVRGAWIPDAVAQMKFSPKHRAVDIGRMLNVISFSPFFVGYSSLCNYWYVIIYFVICSVAWPWHELGMMQSPKSFW